MEIIFFAAFVKFKLTLEICLYTYRVSTLKVEHRQLTLCIQFIDIMPSKIKKKKF
jgi:hypothetical protein